MKYLKKYEAWPDYIHFYGFKKFCILYNPDDNIFTTLELIESTEDLSIIVQTLAFSKKSNDIMKSVEIPANVNMLRKRLVFQSDDIEEIRTHLELLKNTNKYNL